MNLRRITVEVNKLPSSRMNVDLIDRDTVERALFQAFGEDNYGVYSVTVNGEEANLTYALSDGDIISIAKQTKGNNEAAPATPATEPTEAVADEEVINDGDIEVEIIDEDAEDIDDEDEVDEDDIDEEDEDEEDTEEVTE